jgi:hypothetical protein
MLHYLFWCDKYYCSEKHTVRPNSPTPSMGIVVARLVELELEKDRW